jgi:hypothetical protein
VPVEWFSKLSAQRFVFHVTASYSPASLGRMWWTTRKFRDVVILRLRCASLRMTVLLGRECCAKLGAVGGCSATGIYPSPKPKARALRKN